MKGELRLAVGFLDTPVALAHGEFAKEQTVVLLPWGRTELRDGTKLLVDRAGADSVIASFERHDVQIPFDKNHSTVLKLPKGEDAPAYGWGKKITCADGGPLQCDVEWTQEGYEEIKSGRYRYLSPVVGYEADSGRVRMIHSVALTTKPATPHMPALAACDVFYRKESDRMDGLLKRLLQESEGNVATAEQKVGELKKVLEAKGVALGDGADIVAIINAAIAKLEGTEEGKETATEEEAVAASVRVKLGLAKDADKETVLKALSDLEGHVGFVPAAEHNKMVARVDALEAGNRERNARDLVEQCLAEGKLLTTDEKQMKWARERAKEDPEGFKLLMAGAPVIVPQGRMVPPGPPAGPGVTGGNQAREEELIKAAMEEHKGNYGDAMVALQSKLLSEERERTGLDSKHARRAVEQRYPTIFA